VINCCRELVTTVAIAAHVTRLVADVADLGLALGTVARYVPGLLAVVAAGVVEALIEVGTVAGNVARLVAVVACRLVRHVAVAGNVTDAVAPVTSLMILLAFASEMAGTVALVALIAPPVPPRDGSATTTSAGAETASGWSAASTAAIAGEMADAVTSIACRRAHDQISQIQFQQTEIIVVVGSPRVSTAK